MNDSIKKENDDSGTSNKAGWANFWRYEIGVNVIQADTRNKTTGSKWSKYQLLNNECNLTVEIFTPY